MIKKIVTIWTCGKDCWNLILICNISLCPGISDEIEE